MRRTRGEIAAITLTAIAIAYSGPARAAGDLDAGKAGAGNGLEFRGIVIGETPCADAVRDLTVEDKLAGVELDPLTGGPLVEFLKGAFFAQWDRGGYIICDGGGREVQAVALWFDPLHARDMVDLVAENGHVLENFFAASGVGRAEVVPRTASMGAARIVVVQGEAGTDAQLI